jgi:hypothetical protein
MARNQTSLRAKGATDGPHQTSRLAERRTVRLLPIYQGRSGARGSQAGAGAMTPPRDGDWRLTGVMTAPWFGGACRSP